MKQTSQNPTFLGEPLLYGFHFSNLKGDIYGGLTTAVVALPLSLAFGIASGLGPMAGLYSAIFLGFLAALFGGSPAQISGPNGPMTVVMASIFILFQGNPALCFATVMLAGLFQILGGILRIGKYITFVPYPVISGFMTGVGLIIISLQFATLTGHSSHADIWHILESIPSYLQDMNKDAMLLGLLCLGIVVFCPRKIQEIVPSPLLALVIGSVLGNVFLLDSPQIGAIPEGIPLPTLPVFDWTLIPHMIVPALMLAALGTIDSLMTSTVADNMTRIYHKPNKEMIGQGIGNIMAGLFGGIAGSGATMRTSVNIRAGGRTPISGALHALILLFIVLGLGSFAEKIPHAVLGGILLKVGYDIIDWSYIKRFARAPRAGIMVMLLVMLLTVFVNLITAVIAGVIVASLYTTKALADSQLENMQILEESHQRLREEEREILRRNQNNIILFHLTGPMSFGAASEMSRKLGSLDKYQTLILDLSDVTMIDSTSALALEDIFLISRSINKNILLVGVRPKVKDVMDKLGIVQLLPAYALNQSRLEALKLAENLGGNHI